MTIRHVKPRKTLFLSLILAMLSLGTVSISRPVYAVDAVLEAPIVIDATLTPGSTFSINITVANVEKLWGYQFSLWYNTTVLTATGFESYTPFLYYLPSEINDPSGYVAGGASMKYGESVGFSTIDPAPIARVDFEVDSEGKTALHFDTEYTGLCDIYATYPPMVYIAADGFFANVVLPAHDVAIAEVVASKTLVVIGESVAIRVTIVNEGTETETFDVAVKYDGTQIGTATITGLVSGRPETLSFTWETGSAGPGQYLIRAEAIGVEGDADTTNNIRAGDVVTLRRPYVAPEASFTWQPQLPYIGENAIFNASTSFDPDGTIVRYTWNFGDDSPPFESSDPAAVHVFKAAGNYQTVLEVVDNDGVSSSTRHDVTVLTGLVVKLTSPLDYFWRERVRIRLSALVTDAQSMKPVSDATVTVQIYDPDGNLWISDAMVERIAGTGIYEWESSDTIEKLHLQKGVYLVHAQASRGGSPTTSDILEFHIDPPTDNSLGAPASYFILAAAALATVAVGAGFLLKRRRSKTKEFPQRTHDVASS